MDEPQIHQELKELFTLGIPTAIEQEHTYLDITHQRLRETIISRIYAYYLDASNNSEIAFLFNSALVGLINEKFKEHNFTLHDYQYRLEVQTNKGNRIDLLLESKICEEAIIIENKINHILNNDLQDNGA